MHIHFKKRPDPRGLAGPLAIAVLLLGVPVLAPASAGQASAEAVGTAEVLAHDVADWKANGLFTEDGPQRKEELKRLIQRAEEELRRGSLDERTVEILGELYASELTELERGSDGSALGQRLLARLEQALTRDQDETQQAFARAATRGVDPALMRRVLGGSLRFRERKTPSEELIEASIQEALAAGNSEFVLQLGSAAVAPLSALAVSGSGVAVSPAGTHPLQLLAEIDPAAALHAAQKLVSSKDILLKSQVVSAFRENQPFANDSIWKKQDGRMTGLVSEEWSEIVSGLLVEPAVPAHLVDPFLHEFVKRGVTVAGFEPYFKDWLLRNVPGQGPVPPLLNTAALGLISEESTASQVRGANVLLASRDSAPLLAMASNPRAELRPLIAEAFGPRNVSYSDKNGKTGSVRVLPQIDPKCSEALFAFVQSTPDRYSNIALQKAHQVATELAKPVLNQTQLRSLMARLDSHGATTWQSVLAHTLLLPAEERQTLYPEMVAWISTTGEAAQGRFLTMAQALEQAGGIRALEQLALSTPEPGLVLALAKCAALAIEQEPEQAANFLVHMAQVGNREAWTHLVERKRESGGSIDHENFLRKIPSELQSLVVKSLWEADYDGFSWLDRSDLSLDRADWLALMRNAELPLPGREWALKQLARTKGEEALPPGSEKALAELIAELGQCPISSGAFQEMGAEPGLVLQTLLEMSEVDEGVILDLWMPLDDPDLVALLMQRFPPSSWSEHADSPLLARVVGRLTQQKDADLNPALEQANIPGTVLQRSLIEALWVQRSEVHLPVAKEILASPYFPSDGVRQQLVQYVTGFQTDEAAEMLIHAARQTRSESFRTEIKSALEQILSWQETEGRLRMGQHGINKKARAIAELVRLVEDGNAPVEIQAEALRGLATLGAVEEVPRLIAALQSEEEPIRQAARAALDRLQQ